jgi:hypothetical protein
MRQGLPCSCTTHVPGHHPLFEGRHLTIDSWRISRDEEGWKSTSIQNEEEFWDDDLALTDSCDGRQSQAPAEARAVPRLALTTLYLPDKPPLRLIQSRSIATAAYGFGDASGSGLGSSCQVGHTLQVSQGSWGRKESLESSNYRELANLIQTLEEGLSSKALFHMEFFLFTDNSAAEYV